MSLPKAMPSNIQGYVDKQKVRMSLLKSILSNEKDECPCEKQHFQHKCVNVLAKIKTFQQKQWMSLLKSMLSNQKCECPC